MITLSESIIREAEKSPYPENSKWTVVTLEHDFRPGYTCTVVALKTRGLFDWLLTIFGYYTQVDIPLSQGAKQRLWVQTSGVKQFLSNLNAAFKAENSPAIEEGKRDSSLLSVTDLVNITHKCRTKGLTRREARAILNRAHQELQKEEGSRKVPRTPDSPEVVSRNERVPRNMLILEGENGKKECYLLMTRTSKMRDKKLGVGSFKKVKYAIRLNPETKEDQKLFVVGTVDKRQLTPTQIESIRNEIALMREARDIPQIVRLENAFESDSKIYLVQEYCGGGDLFDLLDDRIQRREFLSVPQRLQLARDFADGIQSLYARGILHRDIKLENFMLTAEGRGKVGDLGLSSKMGLDLDGIRGTAIYLSPDLIRIYKEPDRYSADEKKKAIEDSDAWAFGILVYSLFHPEHDPLKFLNFPKDSPANQIFEGLLQLKQQTVDEETALPLPEKIGEVIRKLLQVDPRHRWTIAQAAEALALV